MWKVRKWFWRGLATKKFAGNRPAVIPVPRADGPRLKPVSLASQFPRIPIPNIRVADKVPPDEAQPLKVIFYKFQVAMYRILSPMQPGLPQIDADPQKALDQAYSAAQRKLFPPPVLPAEYQGPVDLGRIAVASPYACYVERAPEGGYQWDLRQLDGYDLHPGLRSLGVRAFFRVDEATRQLETTRIDCELGSCKPGEANWEQAQKLALCAVSTHMSLVRHFNGVHLAAGAAFSVATRNSLPAAHPLRRLIWPHIYGTHYSNQIVTKGQMVPEGDFDSTFSFTHRGMCKLFEDTYDQYDVTVLDPEGDARQRGIHEAGFDTPALANRQALFDVMHTHALRYLHFYYNSDEQLHADPDVKNWVEELERLIPNGIGKVLGGDITLTGVARLVGTLIYLTTVEHEIVGSGLWNYQLWTNVQPVRVYRNGQREPVDVYQRLVNANFNLNVHRAPLMQDFGYLAPDPKGAEAFRTFRAELQRQRERMEAEPLAYWKIYPDILKANINA